MKLLRLIAILVAVLVVLAILGVVYVDSIARKALEEGGTYALGVDTRCDDVSVGLRSGQLDLSGLSVQNPPGYREEYLLGLDSGRLELDVNTLLDDRIVASLLELEGVRFAVERNDQGTNYGKILDHLESIRPPDEGGAEPEPESPGTSKSFVIDRIVIRDVEARVHLGLAGASTSSTILIPEIALDDLASKDLTLAELFSIVLNALLVAVAENGGQDLPQQILADLKQQLSDLGSIRIDQIELGGRSLEDLKGKAKDLEQLGDQVKGILDR